MQNRQLIQRIRDLIENENKIGKNLITYQRNPDFSKFLSSYKIGVKLDQYNEIILQEETGLELGGSDKNSFSVVFPISELELIQDGKISILGHEINSIENSSVDFGIFLLIGVDNALENQNQDLKQMNFISNSIEGYLIRTIPRRFWCRISSSVIKNNFSFDNADGINNFYGKVKQIGVYDAALIDDELEYITGEGYTSFASLVNENNYILV